MSASSSTGSNQWRILCVDDEPDVLEILKITLGTKHEVVTAANGLEAMGMLDIGEPDFILCDIRMPKMDGYQTVEAIRRHPKYYDIPVFFLTAEHGSEKAKRGFASGANLYLTKPFDPMRVLQNIEFFLQEHGRQPRPKRLTPEQAETEFKGMDLPQIPIAPPGAPKPAARPAAAPPAPDAKARVIAICRDTSLLDKIYLALKNDCECVTCADPLGALHHLFRYDPDILIVNPAIPKLSGWGLVQMIRGNKKFLKLPLILVEDESQPIDRRLVPAITKQALIPAAALGGEFAAAVERIVNTPGFTVSPKRSSIKALVQEEEQARHAMEREMARQQRQKEVLKQRYGRIQNFIDSNM